MKRAKGGADKDHISEFLFRPRRGLWNLSGYVLSKHGANKLLDLLPVRGPVDLWFNHQFANLDVFATSRSLIEQRWDYRSDNSYSVLPVLSKRGIVTTERPSRFRQPHLPTPVFVLGQPNTGSTSLAMALSMLGYRCCSDIDQLPELEHRSLFHGRGRRVFDAYVNIGSLTTHYRKVLPLYPRAKVIVTVPDDAEGARQFVAKPSKTPLKEPVLADERACFHASADVVQQLRQLSIEALVMPATAPDKWRTLCSFLQCDPPASVYPTCSDLPQRPVAIGVERVRSVVGRRLTFDKSPWIVRRPRTWRGVLLDDTPVWSEDGSSGSTTARPSTASEDLTVWRLLDDTFPSNLVLFRPANFSVSATDMATLTLRREGAYVRDYTSASLCSRNSYHYGRFEARIRTAGISGLVTGMFLHRNSPRQEIDIEFLGKDPTKLLVNVYYNPGGEGAKFDYGYRGTPVLIDLGFDASEAFHSYALEWSPTLIRWFVDGRLVHERANWEPTPIPQLPMQFYINLWASRSKQFAGRLSDAELPAHSHIEKVKHGGRQWTWPTTTRHK